MFEPIASTNITPTCRKDKKRQSKQKRLMNSSDAKWYNKSIENSDRMYYDVFDIFSMTV